MTDWNEHEDAISDAISDSIDMDWSSRTGAKAVVAWLNENAAAPAPSSLAGGAVGARGIAKRLLSTNFDFLHPEMEPSEQLEFEDSITNAILAALSPEAPAREGVEALRTALIKARSELAIQYCYSAGRMGIAGCYPELAEKYGGSAIVQEIDAVLALAPRHEAPAEGAGEAMTEREVRQWIDACNHEPARQVLRDYLALRDRSSAPEAREGALGNLLAVIHGDGGHRALEVGTKQAALEAEKIVSGLFAAPSADKLRDHLEWIETVLTDPVPGYTARIATAREYIDQVLAAPDALKGDAK